VNRFCLSKKAVFAALTAMIALFAAGCGEREDDEGETVVDDAIERLLSESNPGGAQITTKTEHEGGLQTKLGNENTFIGYSIKAFGGPTFGAALGSQLFRDEIYTDKSDGGGNSYISSSNFAATQYQASLSENLNEVYCNLKVDAGLRSGAKVPWFSGSVTLQYGNKQTLQSESKFYKYVSSRTTKKHSMIGRYAFDVTELVKPDVIDNIIDNAAHTPGDIFSRVGTHIITDASIGGEANIIGLYNSFTSASDKDIDTALNFNSYAEKKTLTDEQKRIANETYLNINSFGGDGKIFAGASFANFVSKMDAWAKTIDGNESLANIYSLIPIWELATDPSRKAQLENFFYDSCDAQNGVLSDYFAKEGFITDSATYEIESWLSTGMYIVVDNYSTAVGAGLVIREKENTTAAVSSRRWIAAASKTDPGYFSFQNVNSGKMIEYQWEGSGDHYSVMQSIANGSYTQRFYPFKNDDGSIHLFNNIDSVSWGYIGDKISLENTIGASGTKIVLSGSFDSGFETRWKLHRVK